jgi:hypothetical protein
MVVQLVEALPDGKSWVKFPMVSLEFCIDIIILATLWPHVWLNLQHKWVQEYFLGGKVGSLNLMELYRPVIGLYKDCFTLHMLK